MSNKKKEAETTEQSAQATRQTAAEAAEVPAEPPEADQTAAVLDEARAAQAREHEQYLRLAAEYDNFRKRSAKEKDGIYQDAKAETAKKFLPVYDNLERALKNETADTAYKKGVEMTMNELVKILAALEIIPFGAAGEAFDPQRHNAVMHIEDETLGENVVAEVFQTGFAMGERVIRFAMVKVAN